MALVTHQMQGCYPRFPSRLLSWTNGIQLNHYVETLQMVGTTDRSFFLKHKCIRMGSLLARGMKGNFKVSAFKGSIQNDESESRKKGSKFSKNPVKTQDSEDTNSESPKIRCVSLPQTSQSSETVEGGSAAVHSLFKKWLMVLHTPSPRQIADEIVEEGTPEKLSEAQNAPCTKENDGILKAFLSYLLRLDATIKIPLLFFIPCYLAINLVYGAQVSKELTPLWVLGPLIVALYIKIFRGIIALYVFSFKQTVKVMKNVPTYYLVTYTYIAHGKLKADMLTCFWQPLVNIRNMDYKEASKKKVKERQEWMNEMYLDYVESIWPFYCRMIRFLKRANLI